MKKFVATMLFIFGAPLLMLSAEPPDDFEKNWPQWRGPLANGIALHSDPPVEWSEDKNVKWKIDLPGNGHATPIIWGDKIFILTAIENRQAERAKAGSRGRKQRSRKRRLATA